MEHELITMDHPWMQKLVKLTNRHVSRIVLDHMRDEGIPFKVPAAFTKMVLNRAALMELTFLDDHGDPIEKADAKPLGDQEPARTGQWILSIDGEDQMHLKSLEIPKLDYHDNEILTVGLTYYAMVNPEKS
ncbi:hypothetical protein LCGC14_1348570 [marine sediment metagenome]|uniref:Uncharacterized protein n=1 Tax=marine sediment metagenome TaxID=412755 RepID=A0A0F9MSC7_9ZZZZ